MDLLVRLQESAFSMWIASSPSLLAYPTFLTLHTAGMAVVVGTCVVMDLRLLGVGSDIALKVLRGAPKLVWPGFLINAATGAGLFAIDAEHKATQTVFIVKLACIALALVAYARIMKLVFRDAAPGAEVVPSEAKVLAAVSLVLWTGATVAGRLMAYLI